jgi:hypothetical protein
MDGILPSSYGEREREREKEGERERRCPRFTHKKTNSPSLFVQLRVTHDAFFFSYSLHGSFLHSKKKFPHTNF